MSKCKEIRNISGLKQIEFSRKYKIPLRTVQDWEYEKRQPADWLMNILERVVIEDKLNLKLIFKVGTITDGSFEEFISTENLEEARNIFEESDKNNIELRAYSSADIFAILYRK